MHKLQRGFAFLAALLILVIVGIIGGTGYYVVHVKNSAYGSVSSGSKDKATLKVESEPAGIDVAGNPQCDSKKLKKTTPYECSAGAAFTTTVTAQDKVTVNGQSYTFKTWDGCSEGNTDKKICKSKVKLGEVRTVKVSYEKATGRTNLNANLPPSASGNDDSALHNQCTSSLSLKSDTNTATCSVTIYGGTLPLGIDWIDSARTQEPLITATCIKTPNDCTLYEDQGKQHSKLPLNTPTTLNSSKQIGPVNPGPQVANISLAGEYPTIVSFSFPIEYSVGDQKYTFNKFTESDNYSCGCHSPPTYYLNWYYKAAN